MQAATALCPREADIYVERGEALEVATRCSLHRLSTRANREPDLRPDAWLTLCVLDQLSRRPDLQLTGRKAYDPIAARIQIQPDIIQAACARDNRDTTVTRRWIHLDFRGDQAATGYDLPPTHLNQALPTGLMDVRIEECTARAVSPTGGGSNENNKPVFTDQLCRTWLRLRIDGWAKDQPPPTAEKCLAAARAHFAGPVPRDAFRKIRRQVVPPSWQKPGPRQPRK
jgi:hypothetical protein